MSRYIFDPRWARERDRLQALEALFDSATAQRLSAIGLSEGWNCLEVGAGAGGIARWMAERVGDSGLVLAIDLNTSLMHQNQSANLQARQHDIVAACPSEGAFDLVHARAVLEHISDRPRALTNMVTAIRPGGWLMIEDIDFGAAMAAALARHVHPSRHAAAYERLIAAIDASYSANGADASFGAALPSELTRLGLEKVQAEVHTPMARGGEETDFVRLGIQHLGPRLLETGLATEQDLKELHQLTSDPNAFYPPTLMITAWGKVPTHQR